MEEKELVERACRGDRDAFETLVRRYEAKVYHLAYGFVQDRAGADDLAQEIFLKVYLSLEKFHFRSGFGTWLYRLAVNHIKDHLRKTARKREVSLDDVAEAAFPSADDVLEREEARVRDDRRKAVLQVLATLPQKYRVILTLRDVEGLPYETIAETLAISPGTVDSRLHRARKMLLKKMTPYLKTEGEGS
jgi:RNA polymerase sigma-70 factor (ECF subfamily)